MGSDFSLTNYFSFEVKNWAISSATFNDNALTLEIQTFTNVNFITYFLNPFSSEQNNSISEFNRVVCYLFIM